MRTWRDIVGIAAIALAVALVAILVREYSTNREVKGMTHFDSAKGLASTLGKLSDSGREEKATFAAGCFWGVEAAFRQVEGVLSTSAGYTGGATKNPNYHDVCSDKTGHAESVEVIFDPAKVSYDQLLDVFWSIHDPTLRNRQGPDFGSQYRSAIFFHTPEQEAAAKASKERLERSGQFHKPIVTEITRASDFYRAEEYHQRYLEKNGTVSCHVRQ